MNASGRNEITIMAIKQASTVALFKPTVHKPCSNSLTESSQLSVAVWSNEL
jgi:hypothetical protein